MTKNRPVLSEIQQFLTKIQPFSNKFRPFLIEIQQFLTEILPFLTEIDNFSSSNTWKKPQQKFLILFSLLPSQTLMSIQHMLNQLSSLKRNVSRIGLSLSRWVTLDFWGEIRGEIRDENRVKCVLVKRWKRRTRKAEQLKGKYEQLNGIFSKAMYEDNCYPEAEQRMV